MDTRRALTFELIKGTSIAVSIVLVQLYFVSLSLSRFNTSLTIKSGFVVCTQRDTELKSVQKTSKIAVDVT